MVHLTGIIGERELLKYLFVFLRLLLASSCLTNPLPTHYLRELPVLVAGMSRGYLVKFPLLWILFLSHSELIAAVVHSPVL